MINQKTRMVKSSRGVMGFIRRYYRVLRFYFVTGALVWVPLIVTLWLTWWLFTKMAVGVSSVLQSTYAFLNDLGGRVPILSFLQGLEYQRIYGILIPIAIFLVTGILARNLAGRRFIRIGERILNRIPVISRVYGAVQQIRDVFISRDGTVFQSVCVVEYPRKGVYAVAFVTSEEQGVVQSAVKKELVSVFVPTTPNPTSGLLLYLTPSEVTPLDISIEDAMKLIISAGAYLPSKDQIDAEAKPITLTD